MLGSDSSPDHRHTQQYRTYPQMLSTHQHSRYSDAPGVIATSYRDREIVRLTQ